MRRRKRFVHIGIACTGRVPVDKLEDHFSKAISWIRYGANCWVICTTTDLETWRDRLLKISELRDGSFFLSEFQPVSGDQYSGWLPEELWKWFQQNA